MEGRKIEIVSEIIEGAVERMPRSRKQAFALTQKQLRVYRDNLYEEDLDQDLRFKSESRVQQLVRQLDAFVSIHDRSIYECNKNCFIKAEAYLAVKII